MVTVYEPDQVKLRGTSPTPLRGADPGSFGQNVGQSAQRFGKALNQTVDVAQQLADQQANTSARTVDIQLSSRIREELMGENGLMSLQGQAYVDQAPAYQQRIEDYAKELGKGAKTEIERDLIARVTQQRLETVRGQIGSQRIREAQFAAKASASARASNQTTNAAMNYRDPAVFSRERAVLDAAVIDHAQAQGIADPAVLQAMKRERYGTVHTYAVQDMIRRGETGQAQSWLDDALIKGEIEPSVANQLQERLEKATVENEIGHLVEGTAPPTPVDGQMLTATPELVAAVKHQESRGVGTAVSPKGAAGVMQVMPKTGPEAARLAKVKWEPDRMVSSKPEDIAYQQQLGEAYLNAQLKRFGGSTVAALAAYNAGPEMVQDWIDGTNKTGKNKAGLKLGDPSANPRAWAAAIPFAETKDYVAKITAKLGGSQRTPLPPNVETVAQVEAWVQQFAEPRDRQAARAAGIAKVNLNRTIRSQREEAAWDAVQPYLQADQPWTSIPKGLWGAMSPQHQTALIEATKRGTNRITSPEALDGIYEIMERDPAAFKQMDLLKLAPDFAPSDFEQLRKMQHQARTGTGEWKKPVAQHTAMARLAPTVVPPSLLKPANKTEYAQFKARWYQAMQTKQAGQTEPLTDDEIAEIGTRLAADVATGGGFGRPNARPLYQFAPDVDKKQATGYSAIPANEQSQVFRFLKQRNGRDPTVGEVLDTWRTLKATGDL